MVCCQMIADTNDDDKYVYVAPVCGDWIYALLSRHVHDSGAASRAGQH